MHKVSGEIGLKSRLAPNHRHAIMPNLEELLRRMRQGPVFDAAGWPRQAGPERHLLSGQLQARLRRWRRRQRIRRGLWPQRQRVRQPALLAAEVVRACKVM